MAELQHIFGNDLTLSANGDLALVSGQQEAKERVLRRLLTNPGDYIWNLSFGAGLGQMVGQTVNPQQIQAIIYNQLELEAMVDQTVQPTVTVYANPDGTVSAGIIFQDANGQTLTLSAPLTL